MCATYRRFAQNFKNELRRAAILTSNPVRRVAGPYGVSPGTLRNLLHQYREARGGTDSELNVPARARSKQLESENQELRAGTPRF